MPQFDVYRNVAEPGHLLDCQSNALPGLTMRLVVPSLPPDYARKPSRRPDPPLRVGTGEVVMMTNFASAVSQGTLGEAVGSSQEDTVIMNAFDMLLTGS